MKPNMIIRLVIVAVLLVVAIMVMMHYTDPEKNTHAKTFQKVFIVQGIIMLLLFVAPALPGLVKRFSKKDEDRKK